MKNQSQLYYFSIWHFYFHFYFRFRKWWPQRHLTLQISLTSGNGTNKSQNTSEKSQFGSLITTMLSRKSCCLGYLKWSVWKQAILIIYSAYKPYSLYRPGKWKFISNFSNYFLDRPTNPELPFYRHDFTWHPPSLINTSVSGKCWWLEVCGLVSPCYQALSLYISLQASVLM